jgi:hypothetical protein
MWHDSFETMLWIGVPMFGLTVAMSPLIIRYLHP